MRPSTAFYLAAVQCLLDPTSFGLAFPLATTTGSSTELITLPARREEAPAAVRRRQENHTGSGYLTVRACCAKAVATINPNPLPQLGMTVDQVTEKFVAGAMLAFGGELSDFGRRITWVNLSLAVMLMCNSLCDSTMRTNCN